MGLRIEFHGVRGSTAAPGGEFAAVGGHTSCVALRRGDEPAPRLVLDAGTGLRSLSASLGHRPFVGTIALTHLHWDHLHGLPFFRAGDHDDARVRLLMPAQGDPLEVLTRVMSPPYFPIEPTGLLGRWSFEGIESGRHEVEGYALHAAELPHKGGRTFGFRVEADGRSLAYAPDHRPVPGDEGARSLCRDVDVLVHDAQFLDGERSIADAYGHATVGAAVEFARSCGAQRLVLFHHGPGRTDTEIEQIAASFAGSDLDVSVAREGAILEV